ncbi:cytochrome ubiquinol oxidase subunit II [Agaricicola taiwanensis]|uniref:Ubiquinol oxidase polypeptide II n=1 Tax=Agaricicola taiwanensis TaxID=591372 RepID=A0A8J2VMQ7_9RHOB|nr:ubiquinol oxidase subunit II [Agaricicola taiwanensis]GGE32030.1 cytochrome ubiquinol oxidase subunit II [Agaricicola taiwanensis]
MTPFRLLFLLPFALLLGGCDLVVMSPSGDIADQQANLIIISTILMLIVIVPVMVMIVLFAWRYRHTNTEARYEPDWDHSTGLELIIWSVPLLIIICLGAVTWMGTHLLDPYRPLDRLAHGKPVTEEHVPLEVQVVALDWKWLFIYPEQGIASVNEMAAPVDRPIHFRITSSSVMNSFYVPALAGMIYAMPGMETTLHAVINAPGEFEGFSANYSGAGFSGMRFAFHGLEQGDFDKWVETVKSADGALNRPDYLDLERPSENVPIRHYASVDAGLFNAILNMCVEEGKMCMKEMMAIDAEGGLGLAGIHNTMPLTYDKYARRGAVFGPDPSYVLSICAVEEAPGTAEFTPTPPANMSPIVGAGLKRPNVKPLRSFPTTFWAAPSRPSNS